MPYKKLSSLQGMILFTLPVCMCMLVKVLCIKHVCIACCIHTCMTCVCRVYVHSKNRIVILTSGWLFEFQHMTCVDTDFKNASSAYLYMVSLTGAH